MKKLNKKRTVLLIIVAIFIVGAIAGVYANTVQSDADGQTTSNTPIQQLWDNVTDALNGQKLSKFDQMVRVMERSIENPIEFNDVLYNYEYLKQVYHLSQEQLDYISDLIIQGGDAMEIMDVVYFWKDTNEDIHIVGEMYALRERYHGVHWIENAFNKVTENKCGVLETEDVEAYLKQGMTASDIKIANKLCRKGVLTIQEILTQRLEGKSFAEIAAQINGEELPAQIIEPIAAALAINEDFSSAEVSGKAPARSEQMEIETIMLAGMLAQINDEPTAVYYQKALDGVSLAEELEETEDKLNDEIVGKLREKGLYKTATREDKLNYLQKEDNENA